MSKNYKIVVAANLILVLAFFAFSVVQKETLISKGTEVLLRLAPVDPRSLMQGDYMALNYQIFDKIDRHFKSGYIVVKVDRNKVAKFVRQIDYKSKSGYVVAKVGSDRVAEFVRVQDGKNVNDRELIIRYKRHQGRLTIGADNYFFQEGSAKKFENAKYGLLKVDSDGNSILVGLCDKDGRLIE